MEPLQSVFIFVEFFIPVTMTTGANTQDCYNADHHSFEKGCSVYTDHRTLSACNSGCSVFRQSSARVHEGRSLIHYCVPSRYEPFVLRHGCSTSFTALPIFTGDRPNHNPATNFSHLSEKVAWRGMIHTH